MESPVVLDKPPENYTNERGFPFDEEEGSDAWSDLLVRHPELAARLRPSSWGRKRRPSSQDGVDDSGDNFGGFDRFPFNSIPPEFRDHFPSQWSDFAPREEQRHQPPSPQHQTTSTQTETEATPTQDKTQAPLPQYGLRNTVDLGQKSPADPSLVDAEDRAQRSMSAPPGHHIINPNIGSMSGQGNQEATTHQTQEQHSNVRHIPIFVEGRDEPVINKNVDHGTHFAEAKPSPHPPHPHVDREQYYTDDGPAGFPFPKSFDRPFFRQGAQPFTKQKMYPQAAFARGTSPQRSQSPKPSFHEQHVPRAETPSKPQQKQTSPHQKQSQPQFNNQNHHQQHATQPPPQTQSPPPPPQPTPPQQPPSANDPISRILSIQTDVLNLMTDVENFTGTKKDKRYIYLDEMLTRNLIKLDNIETDGKENIRQARKEAIKCIQKCIAVLEAKADNKGNATPQSVSDVEMQVTDNEKSTENSEVVQNGDIEMKEPTKELSLETENQNKRQSSDVQAESSEIQKSSGITAETSPAAIIEEIPKAQEVDTQPSDKETDTPNKIQPEGQESTEKKSPKKTVKKRDKSKDTKKTLKDKENKNDEPAKGDARMKYEDESVDNKGEQIENIVNINDNEICVNNKVEGARVNDKSDKKETRSMEVDGAASQ